MDIIFEKEYCVLPSVCDASGALSYPGAFECFMDIASQHAEGLGFGFGDLTRRGLFWLTVKTKILFLRRPRLAESITLSTWPEKPGRIRCNRSYEMKQGEEQLLRGRTEWALIDIGTQRMVPSNTVFPDTMSFPERSACSEPFSLVPDSFDNIEPYAQYVVRSVDIDLGGHMNNAAYLRAMFGTFSNAELAAMEIRAADALFRSPCFEGDELLWQRKETPAGFHIRVQCKEKTVFLASLETGNI